jgi:hypothetical protein
MSGPRLFVIANEAIRARALEHVRQAPEGFEVLVCPPRITEGQMTRFHAICTDIARSGLDWDGQQRNAGFWKLLLISAHTQATGGDQALTRGIEGELVNIRESVSRMERSRAASLIEYATAFAVSNGVRLRDPKARQSEGVEA